jgi:diguanylate cyclase (GGDEF)-like protein
MDLRVRAGVALGIGGLGAAVGAAVTGAALPAVMAGGCALGAAGVVLALGAEVQRQAAVLQPAKSEASGLQRRVADLQEAADAGREAIRVAGTFAEMVAMRNIELTRQASGGLLDAPTGLLDGRYFDAALESRVAAARRLLRPVSIVLLDLDPATFAGEQGPETLSTFAGVLRQTLREADTACRTDEGRFALILEDTPEGGGVWAAERIRSGFASEGGDVELLWAGVASYPSHALDAPALVEQAEEALRRARDTGRGRVEVAAGD